MCFSSSPLKPEGCTLLRINGLAWQGDVERTGFSWLLLLLTQARFGVSSNCSVFRGQKVSLSSMELLLAYIKSQINSTGCLNKDKFFTPPKPLRLIACDRIESNCSYIVFIYCSWAEFLEGESFQIID